jgi:hypothetical protein
VVFQLHINKIVHNSTFAYCAISLLYLSVIKSKVTFVTAFPALTILQKRDRLLKCSRYTNNLQTLYLNRCVYISSWHHFGNDDELTKSVSRHEYFRDPFAVSIIVENSMSILHRQTINEPSDNILWIFAHGYNKFWVTKIVFTNWGGGGCSWCDRMAL